MFKADQVFRIPEGRSYTWYFEGGSGNPNNQIILSLRFDFMTLPDGRWGVVLSSDEDRTMIPDELDILVPEEGRELYHGQIVFLAGHHEAVVIHDGDAYPLFRVLPDSYDDTGDEPTIKMYFHNYVPTEFGGDGRIYEKGDEAQESCIVSLPRNQMPV